MGGISNSDGGIGADIHLTDALTWNAIAFRYRDAFDPDDDYLTPQIATGLSLDVAENLAVFGKVKLNWKDWDPDTVAFETGFKLGF